VHDSTKTVIMTPEKSQQCATLLAQGLRVSVVARQAEVDESTLRKAVKRGVIAKHAIVKTDTMQNNSVDPASSKSERSRIDAQAASGIGVACTRADERIDAALGLATCATTRFERVIDVPMAGLLTGLPALCANGLLSGVGKHLSLPKGYYSALHILLLLGFMALGRIRRPEGLRSIPPGEFGKVIGLDRVPEVRTVRQKIGLLATTGNPQAWGQELSQSWMQADPQEAGYLYVDGHVRVYDGNLANLPKRFVSRERLCLHGTHRLLGQ
jgi:prepilin-type processing-associated H-X9-DG protein